MVEFRWIQMSLFLILMLQFPATTGQPSSVTARFGHDVTLSCGNVIDGQKNCDGTSWTYMDSIEEETVVLVEFGEIRSKPDRLRVTTNCSLVIKKVTDDGVGLYTCRKFKSGRQQGAGIRVSLSVMNMTEREDNDKVIWSCSVLDYYPCSHTVEWLYEDEEEIPDMQISPGPCSDTVTFPSSHLNQSIYELLKCKVTNIYTDGVQLFTFSPQSSGEDATTKSPPTKTTQEQHPEAKTHSHSSHLLISIIVSVGLAALLIAVVAVLMWIKSKENKAQMEENAVLNDEGEGSMMYENPGVPSAIVRLH
ncbi:uncharacterized protein LOC124999287 isoform X2 [Mugil cephalus]|uniref:uncharacterized protein LOC124999287 isoform X2 n=1 Tax=Mugil cephalus TaxID=48193 RepID=UPI001FB65F36|nr:uncharacterized protein LOC124999287 isoform X2 [Mugil cephalus]